MTDISANIESWLNKNTLSPIEIDCVTTVMLKILDGKCKMIPEEKVIMAALYDKTYHCPGVLFEHEKIHDFIHSVKHQLLDENLRLQIYEKRLLAETMLSRPIMKQFKARIRRAGLLAITQDKALANQ